MDDPAQLSGVVFVVRGSDRTKLAGEKGNAVKEEIRREHQQGTGSHNPKPAQFSRNSSRCVATEGYSK